MITVSLNSNKLASDLNNIVQYSVGFIDGIKRGKHLFLKNVGLLTKELLEQFIDSNARSNPQMLHHVYEWYRTGSPESRLFDIDYRVSNIGLSFYSNFKQSSSIKQGSRVPFYNKAFIIENGISVVVRPTAAQALAFEDNGQTIFSKGPIKIENPGGFLAQNGFEKTVNLFFNRYFTQAFIRSSGISEYLKNPVVYKKNLQKGKQNGRASGLSIGFSWIAKAGYKP